MLSFLELKGHKALILTDSNIGVHHAGTVSSIVENYASFVDVLTLEPGEKYKNLDTIQKIYRYLIENKFDRKDFLFALGGGVIGDMTGYAAATYLRGISFVQLPTSLLAMVDSSIGGKTGVDFENYKNMVGAFYQPKAVYMGLSVLSTLPEREFISGFSEIIKHSLILDVGYYQYLQDNVEKALKREADVLEEIIYQSLQCKQQVVEEDPYESGRRAILNFGHTIGHSIEKAMDFSMLHGECVSVGMGAAAYLSCQRGLLSKTELTEGLKLLEAYRLPIFLNKENAPTKEEILSAIKNDKKMEAGAIKFILLRHLGEAYIDKTVTDTELLEAIQFSRREEGR
jgi:3-dehydroquinate synthase